MTYRAEINGLRALAVLPVIFFHAGFEFFKGGFIGVDIFFVISGYLITTIILKEKSEKRFNLLNFYERRIRRILPALSVVMILCIPFSIFLILPSGLENFGQSLVASTFFSNNILLYLTSGYFDISAEYKPLIHTWSLAVEEQFYIVYPLILLSLFKFGKRVTFFILFFIFFISYFEATYFSSNENLKFYSLHTRAFELLIGAILSPYLIGEKFTKNSFVNNFLSFLGLLIILFSFTLFNRGDSFPNVLTIFPLAGTCLVILFGKKGTICKEILSKKYMVYIGLISYSAYLFHQPLFTFLRIGLPEPPSNFILLMTILLTLLISHFTYSYIEKPFRSFSVIKTKFLLIFLLISNSIILSVGFFLHFSKGMPERIYFANAYEENSKFLSERVYKYQNNSFSTIDNTKVLIIGDSFGRDVANIFLETFKQNYELIYAGPEKYTNDADCFINANENKDNLFDSADIVIIASNYSVKECIQGVIKKSQDKLGIFFIGTKHFGHNLNWILRVDKKNRAFLRNTVIDKYHRYDSFQKDVVGSENFISIMHPLIEDNKILITDENGILLSDDKVHLTISGAKYIGKEIFLESKIARILAKDDN